MRRQDHCATRLVTMLSCGRGGLSVRGAGRCAARCCAAGCCTALGVASIMPYIGLVGWDSQHQLPDTLQGKIAMSRWYSYFPEQAYC